MPTEKSIGLTKDGYATLFRRKLDMERAKGRAVSWEAFLVEATK